MFCGSSKCIRINCGPGSAARHPVVSLLPSACSIGNCSSSELISTRAIRSRSRQTSVIGGVGTADGETILLRIEIDSQWESPSISDKYLCSCPIDDIGQERNSD